MLDFLFAGYFAIPLPTLAGRSLRQGYIIAKILPNYVALR
jgi:hypothetical protein